MKKKWKSLRWRLKGVAESKKSQRYLQFWKNKEQTCKEDKEKLVTKNLREPESIVSS